MYENLETFVKKERFTMIESSLLEFVTTKKFDLLATKVKTYCVQNDFENHQQKMAGEISHINLLFKPLVK